MKRLSGIIFFLSRKTRVTLLEDPGVDPFVLEEWSELVAEVLGPRTRAIISPRSEFSIQLTGVLFPVIQRSAKLEVSRDRISAV